MPQSTRALYPLCPATSRTKGWGWTVLPLVLITLSACSRGDTGRVSDTGLPPDTQDEFRRTASDLVDSLRSEPFGPSDLIDRPVEMVASGTHLIIADVKPPFVHVLDLVAGDHTRSFGPEGEGPGDFPSTPLVVSGSARGDTVWFFHGNTGRLSGVAIQDLSADSPLPISAKRTLDPGSGWTVGIDGPDSTGRLLGMVQAPHGIKTFAYSLPSDSVITRGTLALNDTRMDPLYLGDAYQGILCYVPAKDVWVQFFRNVGWAAVIDSTGAIRGEVPIPFQWLPHVEESTKHPGQIRFSPPIWRGRAMPTLHAPSPIVLSTALYLGHLTGEEGCEAFLRPTAARRGAGLRHVVQPREDLRPRSRDIGARRPPGGQCAVHREVGLQWGAGPEDSAAVGAHAR